MENVREPGEGTPLSGLYDLVRMVAARTYNLTAGEAARLTPEQLEEFFATVEDPAFRWRIAWAEEDSALAEAKRILGLEDQVGS